MIKMMFFVLLLSFQALAAGVTPPPYADINYMTIDPGYSGVLSSSGAIEQINVQKAFSIGIEMIITTSGSPTGITASLMGSMDCVNYFQIPMAAAGDARFTVSIPGAGSYYLEKTELALNCVQIYYTFSGVGTLTIKELKKMHDALH